MEAFEGHARVVGLRYAEPRLAEQEEEDLVLYLDMMVDQHKVIRNCKFTPTESYGEYPSLGDYCWVIIIDKEIRIIDG